VQAQLSSDNQGRRNGLKANFPSLLVGLGAGIVTLAGRLLSLGLADLKGSVGFGVDDGAWIPSAFNVALMFIGPFSVYLGGLLGIWKVLFHSAAAFTLISAFLPLVHDYGLMIGLLVIAGLTCGTFYPLTLTFALKNILSVTLQLLSVSMRPASKGRSISLHRFTDFAETIFPGTGSSGSRLFSLQ
jgi:MFS family permease